MAAKRASKAARKRAEEYNKEGLEAYADWDIEQAIQRLQAAIRLAPDEADYYLNLAQVLARAGDFDQALRALARFLQLEPDARVAERFEQLFASGLDEVETILTDKATAAGRPIEEIGVALQMWLEYRITIGRSPLILRKPEAWAAGLDYTVLKVNLHPVTQREIAELYSVSPSGLKSRFDDLVRTLDIMPCDFRYFVGPENPLDKLVEAAAMLEELEARFRAD